MWQRQSTGLLLTTRVWQPRTHWQSLTTTAREEWMVLAPRRDWVCWTWSPSPAAHWRPAQSCTDAHPRAGTPTCAVWNTQHTHSTVCCLKHATHLQEGTIIIYKKIISVLHVFIKFFFFFSKYTVPNNSCIWTLLWTPKYKSIFCSVCLWTSVTVTKNLITFKWPNT